MNNSYNCFQTQLSARRLGKLIDLNKHKGVELTSLYNGLALFKANEYNAAMFAGVAAIAIASQANVPLPLVVNRLSEIVYATLERLIMDSMTWQFTGSLEDVEERRALIADGPDHIRKRWMQEHLGFHERRSNRFLSINSELVVATFNDMATAYEQSGDELFLLIDAWRLADRVRACSAGALFTIESGRSA